jgi:hypothetical protein
MGYVQKYLHDGFVENERVVAWRVTRLLVIRLPEHHVYHILGNGLVHANAFLWVQSASTKKQYYPTRVNVLDVCDSVNQPVDGRGRVHAEGCRCSIAIKATNSNGLRISGSKGWFWLWDHVHSDRRLQSLC